MEIYFGKGRGLQKGNSPIIRLREKKYENIC